MPLSINTKQLAIRVHQGRLLRKRINEKEPDLMEKSQRRMKVTAWWESNGTRLLTRTIPYDRWYRMVSRHHFAYRHTMGNQQNSGGGQQQQQHANKGTTTTTVMPEEIVGRDDVNPLVAMLEKCVISAMEGNHVFKRYVYKVRTFFLFFLCNKCELLFFARVF
jgi:hypothetical protein